MSPLDWDGPTFLTLYGLLFAVSIVTAFITKEMMRGVTLHRKLPDLNVYEIAYLSGGTRAVADAALVKLMHSGCVQRSTTSGAIVRVGNAPTTFDDIERAVYESALASKESLTRPQSAYQLSLTNRYVQTSVQAIRRRLVDLELILPEAKERLIRLVAFCIVVAPALFGVTKILVGVSHGKPVGFLVLFVFVSLIAAPFMAILPRVLRTTFGDGALAMLQNNALTLKYACNRQAALPPPDVAMAFALFGATTISTYPTLATFRYRGTGGGGGCGSSGGSSCGGGGGCGGGCGGCGG